MKTITISEKIRKYRKENSLTQKQLGQLLRVSAQAISKWERCECYPDIAFLPSFAEILGCSVNDFFE